MLYLNTISCTMWIAWFNSAVNLLPHHQFPHAQNIPENSKKKKKGKKNRLVISELYKYTLYTLTGPYHTCFHINFFLIVPQILVSHYIGWWNSYSCSVICQSCNNFSLLQFTWPEIITALYFLIERKVRLLHENYIE